VRRLLLSLVLTACSRGSPASSQPAPASSPRDAPVEATSSLEAGSAPTPPGDPLPHDARSLADAARRRFGQAVHLETVGDLFVLVDLPAHGPLFDRARSLLDRALPAFYDGELSRRPDRAVTVLLFSTAATYRDYTRDHRAESGLPYGMYLPSPREIAVDLSVGPDSWKTLTHEAMHVLLEADFPGAPAWLREGLASLFEEPVFAPDGAIHGAPRNWRHPLLQEALASPTERHLLHLDAVFDLTEARFRSGSERGVALHYALARAVCAWLDSTGQLWPFYRAWRDTWHDDESGRAAFARVTGGTTGEKDGEWGRWVR
jgi:hypothetical protein